MVSWDQLLSIYRQAQDDAEQRRTSDPIDCPNDGTVLQQGPGGELRCPFDGWSWPRDPDPRRP